MIYDLAIIGGGVVGYSALMYSQRLGLKTILIEGEFAGALGKTNWVENYPGFQKIMGMDLVEEIKKHALIYKPTIKSGFVEKINKKAKNFSLKINKKTITSKGILFATGAKYTDLGVKGEKELKNNGVHNCGLCDGPIYKGKEIAIIGGGDSAAKEALILSQFGKKVYMIVRSKLKPEPIYIDKIKKNKKIEVLLKTEVSEISGKNNVEGIKLTKKYKGKDILPVSAVFVTIGMTPTSNLAKDLKIKRNKKGEIKIDIESKTNIPGVYAAGDVCDTRFKQAITGVGEAVKAVYSHYEYLGK